MIDCLDRESEYVFGPELRIEAYVTWHKGGNQLKHSCLYIICCVFFFFTLYCEKQFHMLKIGSKIS